MWQWRTLVAAVALLVGTASGAFARPDTAPGGPEGKGPCVRSCTNGNRGCMRQALVAKLTCRYACADLQEDYLIACGIKEVVPEESSFDFPSDDEVDPDLACDQAKQAFETCWSPCKLNFSRSARSCVGKLRACYFRQCGIFPPPPNPER